MFKGSAIDMQPWVDSVSSIVMTWYLGNEAGNAIADIGKLCHALAKR